RFPRFARLQRRFGKDVVEIAQDRLRFIKAENAVLESGHAAERMLFQINFALGFAGAHGLHAISRLLLLKPPLHRPPARAAWHAVDDDIAHDLLLALLGCLLEELQKPAPSIG